MPDPAHGVHPLSIRAPCLILIVIPESRSDIRDPAPSCIAALRERHKAVSPGREANLENAPLL